MVVGSVLFSVKLFLSQVDILEYFMLVITQMCVFMIEVCILQNDIWF